MRTLFWTLFSIIKVKEISLIPLQIESEKTAEFQLNLLTLEADALGIPDTEYPTYIKMSSSEFVRICRELTQLAESVRIEV